MSKRLALAFALLLLATAAAFAQKVPIVVLSLPPELPTPAGAIPNYQVFQDDLTNPSALIGQAAWLWNGAPPPLPGILTYSYWPAYVNYGELNGLQCVDCVTGGTILIGIGFLRIIPIGSGIKVTRKRFPYRWGYRSDPDRFYKSGSCSIRRNRSGFRWCSDQPLWSADRYLQWTGQCRDCARQCAKRECFLFGRPFQGRRAGADVYGDQSFVWWNLGSRFLHRE